MSSQDYSLEWAVLDALFGERRCGANNSYHACYGRMVHSPTNDEDIYGSLWIDGPNERRSDKWTVMNGATWVPGSNVEEKFFSFAELVKRGRDPAWRAEYGLPPLEEDQDAGELHIGMGAPG